MNKLFLSILIICSFLIGNAYAKKYKVGDIVEKQFYINKKFIVDLPEGKWNLAEKSSWYYYGL